MRNFILIMFACGVILVTQDKASPSSTAPILSNFKYGNLPYEDNRDLTTSYDQLNLFYDHDNISLYGRVEQFLSPVRHRNYLSVTQKRAQYQDEHFDIRLGNFYETIGRGLLLRSYEIPGSVYEDDFYRTRYGFNRDVDGITLGNTNDFLEARVLRGRPLFNPLPPNIEPDSLRRPDLVEAVESHLSMTDDLTFGGAYMRLHEDKEESYQEFVSLMFNGNLPLNFQLSAEYALSTQADFLTLNSANSYAFYTGLNYFFDTFRASLEYKKL